MPKGKKKGKYEHRRTEQAYSSDEDAGIDMTIDNCSETSAQSDLKSNHDDAGKELDIKWSGPRPVNEEKVEPEPVKATPTYCYYPYQNSIEEEVKPDKLSLGSSLSPVAMDQPKSPKTVAMDRPKSPRTVAIEQMERDNLRWSKGQREYFISNYYMNCAALLACKALYSKKTLPEDATPLEVKCPNTSRIKRWVKDETRAKEQQKSKAKTEIQEKFEEKVLEQIESLNARANAARAGAFVSLRASLQRRALDGLLTAHRATLADHVSRALRRGKDGERKAAAAIAPLLALQIGEEGEEEFVREVRPALAATATDKSASLDARTECCSSLAVLCYLMEDDLSEILEVMRMYETIFSGSYLKGDGSVKVSGAAVEEGAWHAAALDGWALLLPLLSPNHALSLLNNQAPSFARLGELLEAVSLEVRMAAGGALAIAYETVTDDDSSENPLTAHVDVLLPRLTELARDSHKFRAKRDRKIQRATFRDILKYFEEGEVSSMSVRIGTEVASWCHWSGGAAYAALAGALGGALQVLAPRCARLRAALALADVAPLASGPQKKLNKLQRHLQNNAANKARTVARNKNRDKRSAALAI